MTTGRTILLVEDEERDVKQIVSSFPNDNVVALAIDHQRPDWGDRLEDEFLTLLKQGCSHVIMDLHLHPNDSYPMWKRLLRCAHERGLIGFGVDVHLWTKYRPDAASELDKFQSWFDGPTFAITDKPAVPTLSSPLERSDP